MYNVHVFDFYRYKCMMYMYRYISHTPLVYSDAFTRRRGLQLVLTRDWSSVD